MMQQWPALPFPEWETTCDTLHMFTQIVGKTRLALTGLENHWWNVALYVTPRGLTTSPIPFGVRTFEVDFDLISHQLLIRTSEGAERHISLLPRSVAGFYAEYMSSLHALESRLPSVVRRWSLTMLLRSTGIFAILLTIRSTSRIFAAS